MKLLKKILQAIFDPFVSVAVMVDESKRINEHGDWDEYWRKKNERSMRGDGNRTIGHNR